MKTKTRGLYAYVFSLMCVLVVLCMSVCVRVRVIKQSKTGVVPQPLDAREMKNTKGDREQEVL